MVMVRKVIAIKFQLSDLTVNKDTLSRLRRTMTVNGATKMIAN